MGKGCIIVSRIDDVEYGIRLGLRYDVIELKPNEQKLKEYAEATGKYKVDKPYYVPGENFDGSKYFKVVNVASSNDSDIITFISSVSGNVTIFRHGAFEIITAEEYAAYNKFEVNNAKLTQKEYNEYLGIEEDEVVLARFKDDAKEIKDAEATETKEVIETVEDEASEEPEDLPIPFEYYKVLLENAPTGDIMTLPNRLFYEGDKDNTIKIKKAKVCDSTHTENPDIHWIAVLNGLEKVKIVAFVEWHNLPEVKVKVLRCLEDKLPMDVYDTYLEYYRSGNMLGL